LDVPKGRITANHFALIRSFLIDSDDPWTLRAAICAKNFLPPTYSLQTPLTQNAKYNACEILRQVARTVAYRRYKYPYFIVFFAMLTMRAQTSSRAVRVCNHRQVSPHNRVAEPRTLLAYMFR
jgi:hypothetical protein